MTERLRIPDGFQLLQRSGPFLTLLGPLYYKQDEQDRSVIAMRIEEKHLNVRDIAHGGMLVTLADSALAIALSRASKQPLAMVTVSLTTDFADSARRGDWVEAHVDIQRVGRRMAYANCYLHVAEKRILRASGVFAVMPRHKPQESFEG